jgi:outer membrane protein assembly factor BamC
MSHKLKLLLLGGIVINLMGCSHLYGDHGVIKNRETDYLKAQNISPMQVPPGYKATIQNNYPVPEKQYPANKTRVDLTPPGLETPAPAAPQP